MRAHFAFAGVLAAAMLIAAGVAFQRTGAQEVGRLVRAPADTAMTTPEILDQVSRNWFRSEWRAYAASFIASDGRVVDNANAGVSHSEGQGYGMLLAALAEDRETFERVWNWTRSHLMVRKDPLLAWKWDPRANAVTDRNNATDGDILVAWALWEAARRFDRPDYLPPARALAGAIGGELIETTDFGPALMPGAVGFSSREQPDGPIVNLSYWVFPAFPALKELAPEFAWAALGESGRSLLRRSRFGPRGVPSDWLAVSDGTTAPARNFPSEYGYNAIRIPLYLAWSGDEDSRRALRRMSGLLNASRGETPRIIEIGAGAASRNLDGAGYRLAFMLAQCAADGEPVDADVLKARDDLYYPATLRMLSLAALQERLPQCL